MRPEEFSIRGSGVHNTDEQKGAWMPASRQGQLFLLVLVAVAQMYAITTLGPLLGTFRTPFGLNDKHRDSATAGAGFLHGRRLRLHSVLRSTVFALAPSGEEPHAGYIGIVDTGHTIVHQTYAEKLR